MESDGCTDVCLRETGGMAELAESNVYQNPFFCVHGRFERRCVDAAEIERVPILEALGHRMPIPSVMHVTAPVEAV